MPKSTPVQTSFNAGEISPKVSAYRVDIDKYYSGCRTMQNFIPLVEGGAMRTPGTYYVTSTKSHGAAIFIPFQFSTTQSYILEFGNQYIRFYKDEGQIESGDAAYEISSPYTTADLFQLDFFQSADTMQISHSSYPIKQLTRTGHTSWTLTNFVAKIQDAFVITGITKANPAVVTVTYTDTAWAISTAYTEGDIVTHGVKHYYCAIDHTSNADADLFEADLAEGFWRVLEILEEGDIVYLSGITGMTELNDGFYDVGTVTDGADEFTFQLSGIDSSDYSAYTSDGTAQQSLYGTDDNNPACGTFFEERMCYGGTNNNPHTMNLSVSGEYDNFTQGDEDDDAIEYTLRSRKVNRIFWMEGLDDFIITGTIGGIWRIGASALGDPITATDVKARRFLNLGSKNIQPELVTDSLMWVSKSGWTVKKLGYSLKEDKQIAIDMTRIAKHIALADTAATSGIKQMAFQSEPIPILWCVRNDGQLLGMTYETQEKIYSWFRIVTNGSFESVAVIGDEGEEEQIWVIVNRTIDGSTERHVEYFKPFEFFSTIEDCFFVHAGLTWDGGDAVSVITIPLQAGCVVTVAAGHSITAADKLRFKNTGTWLDDHIVTAHSVNVNDITLYTEDDSSAIDSSGFDEYDSGGTVEVVKKVFSNLDHLEGEEVDILGDGSVIPSETVASGSITLDYYVNIAHIGLGFESILEPVAINAASAEGSSRGKKQKVNKIIIGFHETTGGKVGPDTDNLKYIKWGTGDTPSLHTENKNINPFSGNWDDEALISIVQDQPLPMTVTGLVAHVTLNEG